VSDSTINSLKHNRVGAVVIGRNEGERLRVCLGSVAGSDCVVYVDSGSTDGSRELARSMGALVVALDSSIPFTAARARSEGFARLQQADPLITYVQFVDGDCELAEGWLTGGSEALDHEPRTAVVCGRLRERRPKASIYNRLCEIEWSEPPGQVDACGGIAMVRAGAFREVKGFNTAMIAGEEPELCVRLRQAGWTIRRLDAEMALHDAAMTCFAQWWRRAVRSGFAFASGAWIHGTGPTRHWVRQTVRVWIWAVAVPIAAIVAAFFSPLVALLIPMVYLIPLVRAFTTARRRGAAANDAAIYSAFCLIGKWAELCGQVRFATQLITSRQQQLIEYRSAPSRE
jgi:GT2 family glycosyltransferase